MTISHYMTISHKKAPKTEKVSPAKARRERETLERREAILAAARDVFFKRGFHRATVDEVAEEAEVAKGTVYLYFESKETILSHLLLEGLDALGEQLTEAFNEKSSFSAEKRLRRLCAAYLDFYTNEPDYFRLMMAFDRGQFQEAVPKELYQSILEKSSLGLQWVVKAIQQGVEDGDLAKCNAKKTAGMLWAAVNGALVIVSHPLRREMLDQEVEPLYNGVMELTIRGLKA